MINKLIDLESCIHQFIVDYVPKSTMIRLEPTSYYTRLLVCYVWYYWK